MKKKILNIAIIMLSVFFVGKIKVSAQTTPVSVPVWEIPSDTYIIGTHMFDEDRTYLSTQDIMWAARTIQGNSKEDMVIYYKDLNNNWVDGLSGESVTIPSAFQIEEVDGQAASVVLLRSVIDTDTSLPILNGDVTENSFFTTNEVEKNYTMNFNAYNIENGDYDFSFVCGSTNEDDDEISLNLGVMPNSVTVENNQFSLPITIAQSTSKNSYNCKMNLGEHEQYFTIDVGEQIPSIKVDEIFSDLKGTDGMGFEPAIQQSSNKFYVSEPDDDIEIIDFGLSLITRYITTGSHSFAVTATKDGQEFELENVPSNINIEYYSMDNKYMSYISILPSSSFTKGEYEFNITIDETTETVYLTIGEYRGFELNSIYNNTDETEYSSIDSILTSEEDKKYTATFETVNIPNGVYNVQFSLYSDGDVYPMDIIRNQTVTVNNNSFDFSYVIPKNTIGNNFIDLKLINNDGIPTAEGGFDFNISSATQTGLKLVPNMDICADESYIVYIRDRNKTTGDGIYRLLFSSQESVDGYEIYSSNAIDGVYTKESDISYEERVTTPQITDISIPINTRKYYKVKPYELVNENKIYMQESNVVEVYDNLFSHMNFQMKNEQIDVTLDDNNNSLLKINTYQNLTTLPSGYVVEESSSPSFNEFTELKNQTFDLSNIENNYFYDVINVTIPSGETKYYRIRSYVNTSNGKIYSNNFNILRYPTQQQQL